MNIKESSLSINKRGATGNPSARNERAMKTAAEIDHIDMRMLESPFHARMAEKNLSEQWTDWNGYKTPVYYFDPHIEYVATRNTCAVFDVSPMCKYRIRGKDAEAMLNRMVTRDVTKQGIKRVAYNVWCNDRGRIIDDGTLFRFGPDDFRLYGAEPGLDWLLMSAVGFDDVEIIDETEAVAGLALQGPTSCALLKAMGIAGVENLKPFDLNDFPYKGGEIMISRTGFTGDLGYELWVAPELAIPLWDELFDTGKLYGIQPMGDESLGLARLEAGFILPDLEFHGALHTVNFGHDHSPFEVALDWIVNFKKPHFNGRQALLDEKERGPAYRLLKLDIEGNKPAEGSILYADEKCTKEIGYVTSGAWSSILKANIAYGQVQGKYAKGRIWAEIYYQKELRWKRKVAECTVRNKPFYAPARAKLTPPLDC